MGVAVLTCYMVALAVALFAGGIDSFASLLVFGLVALVGVVVVVTLGRIVKG
ncbi:MAG TPA: hypothetical protein VIG06_11470 [Kofleriaceae bacterium]|jgi:hypothetical protein